MDAWPVENEGVGEWGAMQPWPLEPELRVGSRHEKQDGGASMLQLLVELGIPECMRESLTAFTPQEFGVVATDITNLDAFLDTLQFPDEPPPVLVTARLRHVVETMSRDVQLPGVASGAAAHAVAVSAGARVRLG